MAKRRCPGSGAGGGPRAIGLLAVGLAMPALTGCFSYTLVPTEPVPVGQDVRILVTREGGRELLGVMNSDLVAPVISGNVSGVDGQSILLRVPVQSATPTAVGGLALGQMIRVPIGEIISMERKDYDKMRTGALIAAAAGGATLLLLQIIDAGRGDTANPLPDPDVLFGLFRIPIG